MGELAKSFGARVKAHRLAHGWTQAQLADASGVSDEWLRKIERGDGNPSFDRVQAIASALGVVPAALFVTVDGGEFDVLLERASKLTSEELAWVAKAIDLAGQRPK